MQQALDNQGAGLFTSRKRLAMRYLEALPMGAMVNREEMAGVIGCGCDPQAPRGEREGYMAVHSAVVTLIRDKRIVFEWLRDEQAWKRLNDQGIKEYERRQTRRTRKANRRAMQIANAVDVRNLSPEERSEHNRNMTVMFMVDLCTSRKLHNRLEQESTEGFHIPNAEKVIELMK